MNQSRTLDDLSYEEYRQILVTSARRVKLHPAGCDQDTVKPQTPKTKGGGSAPIIYGTQGQQRNHPLTNKT